METDENDGLVKRGFARLPPDKHREIAAKGGANVPKGKRSFSVSRELAAEAGRKGGQNVPNEARSFSTDKELAKRAGRIGGRSSGKKNPAPTSAQEEDQLGGGSRDS